MLFDWKRMCVYVFMCVNTHAYMHACMLAVITTVNIVFLQIFNLILLRQ